MTGQLLDNDTYRSVAVESEGLYKDRGSRFISYVFPVTSEAGVKEIVERIRREHHAAKHHCYAYRLGRDGGLYRANDDGEPSGSAGRPILGAIDSAGVSDVLVVVVRYFGGILLGVPGLVKAYRESAADALSKAGTVVKTAAADYELEFDYPEADVVKRFIKMFDGAAEQKTEYNQTCLMTVKVNLSKTEEFEKQINLLNNEKSTRIQCRPLQTAPTGD